MHDIYVQRKQDLPLPSSFLLDGQGRLAVIYKGPLPTVELLADVAALEADSETRRSSAVPFPGRWASKPFRADPEPIVQMLDKLERTVDAVRYARRCIAEIENSVTLASGNEQKMLIDLHGALGELLLKQGQLRDADVAFSRALDLGDSAAALHRHIGESYLEHNLPREALDHLMAALVVWPNDDELLYNLGIAELAAGKLANAITHLKRSHELAPNDANVCFQLANALHGSGATREALLSYRQALKIRPGWSFATNNLAWILATNLDASLRDGREAVRLAEALCLADDYSDPSSLATLAAAYAEVGRFDDAVLTNKRAVQLAEELGQSSLAKRLSDRAATFAAGRAVRE
jgi:tetratricopeptide (TPR) repeat protein